jgi:hypothetical protein
MPAFALRDLILFAIVDTSDIEWELNVLLSRNLVKDQSTRRTGP